MKRSIRMSIVVMTALVVCVVNASQASPYATSVYSYVKGLLTESPPDSGTFFDDPDEALGAPDTQAAWLTPSGRVVQLGQGGSITLGFDAPIMNKPPGARPDNPLGVDFIVFGNAFERGIKGSGIFYCEPGFVEVARKKADGAPDTFYLILPGKLPSQLIGETDTGQVTTLLNSYADVHPVNGTGDPLLAPEQTGSAGGDGFLLERAVLQSSPGVPLLDGLGQPQFVTLDSIDFVRITDALPNDILHDNFNNVIGGITTDVDAVAALPAAAPEPSLLPVVAMGLLALRRGRRVGN